MTRLRIDLGDTTPEEAQRIQSEVERFVRGGLGTFIPACADAKVELRDMASTAQIEAARADHRVDGELEVDDDAELSESDHGVWVSAWLFVYGDQA